LFGGRPATFHTTVGAGIVQSSAASNVSSTSNRDGVRGSGTADCDDGVCRSTGGTDATGDVSGDDAAAAASVSARRSVRSSSSLCLPSSFSSSCFNAPFTRPRCSGRIARHASKVMTSTGGGLGGLSINNVDDDGNSASGAPARSGDVLVRFADGMSTSCDDLVAASRAPPGGLFRPLLPSAPPSPPELAADSAHSKSHEASDPSLRVHRG
jgi:hypothetical protein